MKKRARETERKGEGEIDKEKWKKLSAAYRWRQGRWFWEGRHHIKRWQKGKRKKKEAWKKEQKKSTRCFFCIDLKLATERRKRKEGGRMAWSVRWENRESAAEVWLLSRSLSLLVCECVCVYGWWSRLISLSEECVSVSHWVESQFRDRTTGLEWHVTDSTVHTAD